MTSSAQPITVVVRRAARPGRESEFEEAMKAFIAESLVFPGSGDFHVVRPGASGPREYTIVHRFDCEAARREFVESAMYARWMARLREITEDEPRMQEYSGLAGWFTLPENAGERTRSPGFARAAPHGPPPKLRMAAVTFIGVYPLTSTLPSAFGKAMPGVHPLIVNIFVTGTIVALLTWAVMPLLTRVLARWLFAPRRS